MNLHDVIVFIEDIEWEEDDKECVEFLKQILNGLQTKANKRDMYVPDQEECAGCIFNHHGMMCLVPERCRDKETHKCSVRNKYLPYQAVAKLLAQKNEKLAAENCNLKEENEQLKSAINKFISQTIS